jgi:hypothetical protein
MSGERPMNALQIIFSFFVGLMVTALIGVGVYTFYPPPETQIEDQVRQLTRQMEDIQAFKEKESLTAPEQARMRDLEDQRRELEDMQRKGQESWGGTTSIVLITFATMVMSVSLIRAEHLRVLSNGLLLGGLFTMIYGTGWIIATGSSTARFFVLAAAVVITIGLGYVKFVRGRATTPAAAPVAAGGAPPADPIGLEARVTALEERLDTAARALGKREG